MRREWVRGGVWVALGALLVPACQPAGRYKGKAARSAASAPEAAAKPVSPPPSPEPLPPDYAWMEPNLAQVEPPIPIVFVHSTADRAEWAQLTQFWTLSAAPLRLHQPAAALGLPPLAAGALAAAPPGQVVKVKVPLGLDDPNDRIPAANPPTVGKWELGKRLFFDDGWLPPDAAGQKQACASCHQPARGFTDGAIRSIALWNTPTLLNGVFNDHQFWDGRANALEEVVQQTLDDERDRTDSVPRHAWGGVVKRLRERSDHVIRFRQVFGTPPTQDAVGKALATYLRTLLTGNSLHDRAEEARHARSGDAPEARDYEKVLDAATAKALEPDLKPAEVAAQLAQGQALFRGRAGCVQCHGGRNFTDNGFHNLGVGESSNTALPGQEFGRFARLPPGAKDLRLMGAFKTPTLRGLPRTGPYFHDGLYLELFEVVRLHADGGRRNPYLDPLLRDPADPARPRRLGLKEDEIRALVLFLQALDGGPMDPVVADPSHWPDGVPRRDQ